MRVEARDEPMSNLQLIERNGNGKAAIDEIPPIEDQGGLYPLPLREAFVVDTIEKADWVVGLIYQQEALIENIEKRAESQILQARKEIARIEARFGLELQQFAATQLEGKERRSVKLLSGTLAFRRKPGGYRVTDKDGLLSWAKEHAPDIIEQRVVETVPKAAVDKFIEDSGEIPAGVDYVAETDEFSINTGRTK